MNYLLQEKRAVFHRYVAAVDKEHGWDKLYNWIKELVMYDG